MKFNIILVVSTLICGNAFSQDQWVQKDSVNGAPRSVASSFVIDGEGYVMGGLDDGGFRRSMFSYTYWQDDWDDEPSIGGLSGDGLDRGSACAFSIENKGYLCLGQGDTNPFFNDLWEFDEDTDAWTQKANFIGSARRQAIAFVLNKKAYVGTGIDANGLQKDMYQYNAATNVWTQVADFGGTARKENYYNTGRKTRTRDRRTSKKAKKEKCGEGKCGEGKCGEDKGADEEKSTEE